MIGPAMPSSAAARDYLIQLDLDEGRLVFEALAEQPFKAVYMLIGRFNSQANAQAHNAAPGFRFDAAELSLIVHALGALPFSRVHRQLASLNAQIQAQSDTPSCTAPATDAVAHGRR